MKWLDTLIQNTMNFTVLPEYDPGEEVSLDEKVLGEVPPDLQKMKSYHQVAFSDKLRRMLEEHVAAHKLPGHSEKDCEAFSEKMSTLEGESDLIMKIFWKSLRTELGIEHVGTIGLRKGWKVVECPPKKERSIFDGMGFVVVGLGE